MGPDGVVSEAYFDFLRNKKQDLISINWIDKLQDSTFMQIWSICEIAV